MLQFLSFLFETHFKMHFCLLSSLLPRLKGILKVHTDLRWEIIQKKYTIPGTWSWSSEMEFSPQCFFFVNNTHPFATVTCQNVICEKKKAYCDLLPTCCAWTWMVSTHPHSCFQSLWLVIISPADLPLGPDENCTRSPNSMDTGCFDTGDCSPLFQSVHGQMTDFSCCLWAKKDGGTLTEGDDILCLIRTCTIPAVVTQLTTC